MTPPQPRKETLSPRAAHGRPRWVVWGLCAALVIFLFALSSAVPSQSQLQPPKLKEEQLEALAVGLSLKPPDRGWEGTGESHSWGPATQGEASRGGRYVLTSAGEDDLERLTIASSSLRRHAPAARLVAFVDERAVRALAAAEAAHAHIVHVKHPKEEDAASALHRLQLYRAYLEDLEERDSEAAVLLVDGLSSGGAGGSADGGSSGGSGGANLLFQGDVWQHPLVQQLVDEDALLFSLEGGPGAGKVPLKAQPQLSLWLAECFGAAEAKALADAPLSCAGVTVGSVGAVLGYVSQLLQIATNTTKCSGPGSALAAHQYMVHRLGPAGNLSFPFHVRENWASPLHAAAFGWPAVIDRQGVFRRDDGAGEAPPVVLQYSSTPQAAEIFLSMYPLGPAPRAADIRWEGPSCTGEGVLLDSLPPCKRPSASGEGGARAIGGPGRRLAPAAATPAVAETKHKQRRRGLR